jgi:hypothetical protein
MTCASCYGWWTVARRRRPQPSRIAHAAVHAGEWPTAGYDGAKRKRGRKIHRAVDTLAHPLALHLAPANAQERTQVEQLAA